VRHICALARGVPRYLLVELIGGIAYAIESDRG
jgi:hypothetical protein